MNEPSRISELERVVADMKADSQAKSDFISIMVHQLRTPLSASKWIFKMMLDGDLGAITDEQRKIISRGFESNNQMIRMLAEISQANHVSEWKLQFQPSVMNIMDCIDSTISEFGAEAKMKRIIITYQGNRTLPDVMADKEKICLVVQNLVENAIKYNRSEGSVIIAAEPFKDMLVVSIRDSGIGIPLDDQKNIFGKFYRADNARSHEKGTGLGLFVGKTIVEAHHGTIWFESTPDIGTTFFFSIPLAKRS